jgi:hypothetical protein
MKTNLVSTETTIHGGLVTKGYVLYTGDMVIDQDGDYKFVFFDKYLHNQIMGYCGTLNDKDGSMRIPFKKAYGHEDLKDGDVIGNYSVYEFTEDKYKQKLSELRNLIEAKFNRRFKYEQK